MGKLGNHKFFPALAGNAGILFLGLIIGNLIMRCKTILLKNRIKEEKIVQYHVGQGLFSPSRPRIRTFPNVLPGWVVDLYSPRVVYRKTLNFYRISRGAFHSEKSVRDF